MSNVRTEGPSSSSDSPTLCWQPGFLQLLPMIERHARYVFHGRHDGESLEEAVQEVVCNACVAYARLAAQGRADVAAATSLAKYAVSMYWAGRRVGAVLNVNDVCSTYCQRRRGINVRSLNRWDDGDCEWREMLVEDRTAGPAELAASRIDFAAFMASLGRRARRIAELLSIGETTNRVAELLGVTAGRISQVRRELLAKWQAMHEPLAEAG